MQASRRSTEPLEFVPALNSEAPLFKLLKKNPPTWWNTILTHKKLYIEIRKDNYINIYYQGGSIARIVERNGCIQAKAHPKYMGHHDITDRKFYRNTTGSAIYTDCSEFIENHLEEMLKNVEQSYSNKNNKEETNPEKISEKKIQGELIIQGKREYLDSELEYLISREQGSNRFIRIDLIRVKENQLQFVELKRIQDNRLLNNDESAPEIISQMNSYSIFIRNNSEKLLSYYKTLYRIKRELGLPTPAVDEQTLTIDTTPILLIKNLYRKETSKRKARISRIETLLQKNGIIYELCK